MARLTRREIQCVQLVGYRLSNQEIADALGIAVSTVANNLSSANGKLGTSHRLGAAEELGIRYPGAGMTDAEIVALLPDHRRLVVVPGVEKTNDNRPCLARHWRPLPKGPIARTGLILGVALVWLLMLGGVIPVVQAIFETLDRWRPSYS